MRIIVEGISQKGKNRVREHGSEWIVDSEHETILFNDEKGPWYHIYSVNDKNKDYSRWINKNNDKDFKIKFIKEE